MSYSSTSTTSTLEKNKSLLGSDVLESSIKEFAPAVLKQQQLQNESYPGLGNTLGTGGISIKYQNDTPWYKDGEAMQGYAGLAGTLMQAAALPGQMKLAKLQRQGLQENIKQAKTDNAFRAQIRANLAGGNA